MATNSKERRNVTGLVGLDSIWSALSSARSIFHLLLPASVIIIGHCPSEKEAECGESYLILKQVLTNYENGACHYGK